MAYFERTGPHTYRATEHTGGAWDLATQHIAPALGLLAHVVEVDHAARRTDALPIVRLSYDILGTLPIEEVETDVSVLRPGRSIELVEATLSHAGRVGVRLRAWLLAPRDTVALCGTPLPSIPPPASMDLWEPADVWPGGFIQSVEVRRQSHAPGRAAFWVRARYPLVRDEEVSRFAAAVGVLDIANGMAVRVDPRAVAFPNLDLTAHFFEQPAGEWLGLDTAVSFGAQGFGLTESVIHDESGPIGTSSQALTVRPS